MLEKPIPGWQPSSIVLAWTVTAAVAVGTLVATDSTFGSAVLFLSAWAASTLIPGVLLWRTLAGPTTISQELGFGAGIGTGFALVTWLVSTATGVPALGWIFPSGLVLALALFRTSRRRLLAPRPVANRLDWRWHLTASAVAVAGMLLLYASHLSTQPLPPRASATYPDLWYHVTLVNELSTAVVPLDPSALGESVVYHWFAHAHMALLSVMSGVPGFEVVLHMWFVAMMLTMVLVSIAAVERLQGSARRWWVGPVGALVGIVLTTVWFGNSAVAIMGGFTVNSPTNILALIVILVGVGLVEEVMRSPRRWQGWLLLVANFAVAAGTKPSALPVIAAGGALVALVATVHLRRPSWPGIALVVIPLGMLAVASRVLFGSTGASEVQLFQSLALSPAVQALVGADVRYWEPGTGGALAPFLDDARGGLWVVSATVLIGSAIANIVRLAGLVGAVDRHLRRDPTWVWAAGAVFAGFSAQWMIAHPGYSQLYFWYGVIPLGAALSFATAARITPSSRGNPRSALAWWIIAVSGLIVGVGAIVFRSSVFPDRWGTVSLLVASPYLIGMVVLVVLMVLVRRFVRRPGAVPLASAVVVFGVAVSMPYAVTETVPSVEDAVSGRQRVSASDWTFVSSAAQEAALWLRENSSTSDVVATNVFCQPVVYSEQCSQRAFWLAAIADRQLLLGGWEYTTAYIDLSSFADGNELRPGPWPERVDVSLDVIQSGSPSAAEALVTEYGVRWVFADRDATPVSDELRAVAELRFQNDEVAIYRLD